MELVSKELIVNELKRRIDLYNKLADTCMELNFSNSLEASKLLAYQYESLLSFIDTLEVKESPVDAFIEKACEWIKEKWDDNYTMPIIIDSVIEDFKNYMEGE